LHMHRPFRTWLKEALPKILWLWLKKGELPNHGGAENL
jgi:hypothetical protein